MDNREATTREKWFTGLLITGAVMLAGFVIIRLAGNTGRRIPISVARTPEKTAAPAPLYRETGKINVPFHNVTALAVRPDGGLLVAGDRAITGYDAEGRALFTWKVDKEPVALAMNEAGTVYVATHDNIFVLNTQGTRLAAWKSFKEKAYLTSLAVRGRTVWAADAGNRVVWQCDGNGKVQAEIGKRDDARDVPGLIVPSPYLEVTAGKDALWVTNPGRHEVEGFSADGRVIRTWGHPGGDGFLGCCNPTQLALLPDGGFITAEKGIPRVKYYRADGTYGGLVAGDQAFRDKAGAVDLAVDARGRILVLDGAMKAVRLFSRIEKMP